MLKSRYNIIIAVSKIVINGFLPCFVQLSTSVCHFEYLSINYTVTGMEIINETIVSGILTHHGGGNITFSIMSGLHMDHNYTLMVLITSSSGDLHNAISSSIAFGKTIQVARLPYDFAFWILILANTTLFEYRSS